MAPILVDKRDLLKLSITAVLVVVFVFSGGFFMGYQQAVTVSLVGSEVGSEVDSEIQSLSLPKEKGSSQSAVESQAPTTKQAGEKIDVDQPEVTAQVTSKVVTKAVTKTAAKTSNQSKKKTTASKKSPGKNKTKNTSASSTSASSLSSTSQSSEIKYSIQVGVYVRLVNAKNMMEMLKVQQYDAYVTDFMNKNNQTRYNVRVGYFSNKKSALKTLDKFKADQKSDGYLVNFSAESIVDTTDTDAAAVKKLEDTPAINDTSTPNNGVNDEMKKEPPSIVVPTDTTQDKIS